MKKYVINLEKIDKTTSIPTGVDKVGGQPTYLPPYEPIGFFIMEIFNDERKNWKDGVLCWQFYQSDEFGGPIEEIIEVLVEGAKLNLEKNIPKRRWQYEYIINYTEAEEESADFENFESKLGGIPTQNEENFFKKNEMEYLGELFSNLCSYMDISYGLLTLIKDKDGKIQLI